MDWFLVVISVATYSNMPGRHIGPLTEVNCRAAQAALTADPSFIDARCKRAVAFISCAIPGAPWMAVACPIFEGEGFVPTGAPR